MALGRGPGGWPTKSRGGKKRERPTARWYRRCCRVAGVAYKYQSGPARPKRKKTRKGRNGLRLRAFGGTPQRTTRSDGSSRGHSGKRKKPQAGGRRNGDMPGNSDASSNRGKKKGPDARRGLRARCVRSLRFGRLTTASAMSTVTRHPVRRREKNLLSPTPDTCSRPGICPPRKKSKKGCRAAVAGAGRRRESGKKRRRGGKDICPGPGSGTGISRPR